MVDLTTWAENALDKVIYHDPAKMKAVVKMAVLSKQCFYFHVSRIQVRASPHSKKFYNQRMIEANLRRKKGGLIRGIV